MLLFRAMSNSFSNPTPQFGTAEYVGKAGGDHCQFCHQPIAGNYYRVNGAIACGSCASTSLRESARDTHTAFTRSLFYGIGAAIAGLILYAIFEIETGIIIGYVSLAVGWMVGKAMMKGSNGIGGRRYQVAAALLTYAAVSLAALPVLIHYARRHEQANQANRQSLAEEQRQLETESGQTSRPLPQQSQTPRMGRSEALGRLAVFGLASPFFEVAENPFGGLIGLLILFIGIRIAVRITAGRPAEVFGPFDSSAPAA